MYERQAEWTLTNGAASTLLLRQWQHPLPEWKLGKASNFTARTVWHTLAPLAKQWSLLWSYSATGAHYKPTGRAPKTEVQYVETAPSPVNGHPMQRNASLHQPLDLPDPTVTTILLADVKNSENLGYDDKDLTSFFIRRGTRSACAS